MKPVLSNTKELIRFFATLRRMTVIAPIKDTYPLENGVRVAPLRKFLDFLESLKH